jgi:TRAF3-interacting protein 1
VTQQDLQVKTSKIVAGLEAEKTNELFQALAYALENKLDSKEAISSVKNGNNPPQTKIKTTKIEKTPKIISQKSTKTQPPSRDRTPTNEVKQTKKLPSKQNSLERKASIKEKEKPAVKEKVSSRSKVSDKKIKKVPSKEIETKQEEKVLTNGSTESHNSITPPRKNSQEEVQLIENQQPEQEINNEQNQVEEPKTNGDANHNHVEVKINLFDKFLITFFALKFLARTRSLRETPR